MPIVDVELVEDEAPAPVQAAPVADAVGEALGAPAGRTWVRLRRLAAADYAESGGGPPAGVRPVFVRLLLAEPPTGEALEAQVTAVTQAVARACERPAAHVHVLYEAPARGRLAFGGRVVAPA